MRQRELGSREINMAECECIDYKNESRKALIILGKYKIDNLQTLKVYRTKTGHASIKD